MEKKVFWYYAGNRPAVVVIDGESTLASPHKFLLASPGQKWPKPIAHLFRRKSPKGDVLAQFGGSGKIAEEYKAKLAEETREARKEERAREKSERGKKPRKLALKDAVKEKGKSDPPKKSTPADAEFKSEKSSRSREKSSEGDKK